MYFKTLTGILLQLTRKTLAFHHLLTDSTWIMYNLRQKLLLSVDIYITATKGRIWLFQFH